jgi:hypothetical protein
MGEPLNDATGEVRGDDDERISSHLGLAIFMTIACCFPIGLRAMYLAAKARERLEEGDREGARVAASDARRWAWIAFWVGLLKWICVVIVAVVIAILIAMMMTDSV